MFRLDDYPEYVARLVREFDALLRCNLPIAALTTSSAPSTTSQLRGFRLLQLFTVNLSAVTSLGSREAEAENCRPLLQELALQLSLEMFATLAKHCANHLREHTASKQKQVRSPLE